MKKGLSNKIAKLLLLSFGLVAASCAHYSATGNRMLNSAAFEKHLEKENGVLLDVRTQKEYDSLHIPGAMHIDILKGEFDMNIASLNKQDTYYVYCRSAKRSDSAVNIMKNQGFINTYQLKGGMKSWKGATESNH